MNNIVTIIWRWELSNIEQVGVKQTSSSRINDFMWIVYKSHKANNCCLINLKAQWAIEWSTVVSFHLLHPSQNMRNVVDTYTQMKTFPSPHEWAIESLIPFCFQVVLLHGGLFLASVFINTLQLLSTTPFHNIIVLAYSLHFYQNLPTTLHTDHSQHLSTYRPMNK